MKIIKLITIFLFILCLLIPLVFFNFTPNSVSEIDNRKLTENPFSSEVKGDLTKNIENYVNDRIGLRDSMIRTYTILNDKLFGKMVHPSYTYGKDGYIFGAGITTTESFSDYHVAFADMVLKLQEYCEERGVPFLFIFNPAKPAVLSDKLAEGINYNRDWVEKFLIELDARNINYVDNTGLLKELMDKGVMTFNQKYDANHWNDTGAFYGTQNALKALSKLTPNVHINDESEFNIGEEVMTSLMVSDFPINEAIPVYSLKLDYENETALYVNDLERHPSYRNLGAFRNETREAEGNIGALVFQGSYMNFFGNKFFINAFSEYVYVHDYQNVLDLPYYFNIFKPDCVIFEVAEYTFSDSYFDYENMLTIDYNEPLGNFSNLETSTATIKKDDITVTKGDVLTKLTWQQDEAFEDLWFIADCEYDMKKLDGGYSVTVRNEVYEEYKESFTITAHNTKSLTLYSIGE